MLTLKKRIENSIWGFVVGDMYGVPYEFKSSNQIPKNPKLTGFGTHNQPLGTWSDDTSLLLATMDSIVDCGSVNVEDIRLRFKKWLFDGEYTPNNCVFDCGNTTKQAIIKGCGQSSISDNGNGSLMRILPIAIWTYLNRYNYKEIVYQVSAITHNHGISKNTCLEFVNYYHKLLDGYVDNTHYDKPKNTEGFVVDSLQAALYCYTQSNTYLESIKKAICLGGDTDTNAAITGSLSGFKYGKIPHKKKAVRYDFINNIVEKFINKVVF